MDLAQLAVDTMRAQGTAIQSGMEIGRAQAFREVEAWIKRNADPATGMAHTETLLALCRVKQ